jgi:hypothetical protein
MRCSFVRCMRMMERMVGVAEGDSCSAGVQEPLDTVLVKYVDSLESDHDMSSMMCSMLGLDLQRSQT